jgi:hypothetical protein
MSTVGIQPETHWDATVRRIDEAVHAAAEAGSLKYSPGGVLGGGIVWDLAPPDCNREISVIADIESDGFQVTVHAAKPNRDREGLLSRRFWTGFVELTRPAQVDLNAGVTEGINQARDWLAE